MGCNNSRLDRLPAVSLCRDRCKFLDEALRQSYALADAHVAHMESLKTLGPALRSFFHQYEDSDGVDHSDEQRRNGDEVIHVPQTQPSKSTSPCHSLSSFDSDSHFKLHSESEAEDKDKDFQFFNQTRYDYIHHDTVSPAPDNVVFMNYVEPLYDPFSRVMPNSGGYSNSKPPSPPPPSSSAWDFLNFFEIYEKYEVPYNPGREMKVDEKEKESSSHHSLNNKEAEKKVDGVVGSNGGGKVDKPETAAAKKVEINSGEKNSIPEKMQPETTEKSDSAKEESAKGVSEVMKEIQILLQRASDSGNSILEMMDVGKLRYHRKIAVDPASCKMMHALATSVSSKSTSMECSVLGRRVGCKTEGADNEKGLRYENLSSTLKKLCMWEKKLYDEVKAEEKLRMLHEKKCRQLRRMNKKDADAHKVEAVQSFIGVLSTKMKISIQVVDKISNTIDRLREEELWPQINQFIIRFCGMWKEMLECYRCQCQAIAEAKSIDSSSFSKNPSYSHVEAAIKLKSEVQNWNLSFSDWIYAQKSHIKALNGWLLRCLMYEPEEIPDGSASFSPATIGAPPVFVICNKWSRAVDKISEKDVTEALNGFIIKLNELLEKNITELKQKLTVDKELEKKVKTLERQEQKMHKLVKARERKTVSIAGEETDALLAGVLHSEVIDGVSLQLSLRQIFSAMERFTANTARAYEELSGHIEQDSDVLGESNKIH